MENWLVKFIRQKMRISHAKLLIKHFESMYGDLSFVLDVIHVIIYIVTLGCRPNIDLELWKTFFQEFLQSMMENESVRTLIEVCGDQNLV